jgi:hypothetical protein
VTQRFEKLDARWNIDGYGWRNHLHCRYPLNYTEVNTGMAGTLSHKWLDPVGIMHWSGPHKPWKGDAR